MKKLVILLIITSMIVALVSSTIFAQEKRIYNDGVVDYVPVGTAFSITAEDLESGIKEIQVSVDGSPFQTYTEPIILIEEGRHIIVYRAIDITGNVSRESIYTVVVDGTPPDGLVSVIGPKYISEKGIYITSESMIVLWAEDALSGVQSIYFKLDENPYIAYTEPIKIEEEGLHRAEAYAVDNVGNRTPTFVVEGYVDNSPPLVAILPKEDLISANGKYYTNRDNEYFVRATDRYSGVKAIYISIDDSPYALYSGPFRIQSQGLHKIAAKAVDNIGNESSLVSLSFFVDVTPPVPEIGSTVE